MYVFPLLVSPVDILPVSPVVVVYDLRSKVGIFSVRQVLEIPSGESGKRIEDKKGDSMIRAPTNLIR